MPVISPRIPTVQSFWGPGITGHQSPSTRPSICAVMSGVWRAVWVLGHWWWGGENPSMGNQVNARPTSGHVRFPQRAADTHTGCQGSGGLCVHLCAFVCVLALYTVYCQTAERHRNRSLTRNKWNIKSSHSLFSYPCSCSSIRTALQNLQFFSLDTVLWQRSFGFVTCPILPADDSQMTP